MGEVTRRLNPKTGRYEIASIGADLTKDQMEDRAATERLTDTSRLGSVKPKPVVEEMDPDKMSPLARAAYETKKKRMTTDDAAAALSKKRSY